jgi:hypothetical protein
MPRLSFSFRSAPAALWAAVLCLAIGFAATVRALSAES